MTSLKGLLNEAVTQQKVAVNVASKISVGKDKKDTQRATVPSLAHVRLILAELDKLATQPNKQQAKAWRRYRALIAVAIHTGMRASEVRGLPWAAVEFDAGKIHVRRKLMKMAMLLKSLSRTRAIGASRFHSACFKCFRAWKLEAGGHSLVFPTKSGEPMSLPNIYNRAWKPLQLSLGLTSNILDEKGDIQRDEEGKPIVEPLYNFHLLRHFHASMLIADNANPKEVQSEMGHSDIKITYDLYGHLFVDEESDRRRQQRSERLANLLG